MCRAAKQVRTRTSRSRGGRIKKSSTGGKKRHKASPDPRYLGIPDKSFTLPKKVTKILGVDVGTISEGKIILTQKKTYTICVRKLKRGYHKVEYSVLKLNFSKDVARKIAKKWFKEKGQRTLNWMRKNLRVTYWEFPKAIYSYLPKRADKEVTDSIAIYYEGGRFHSYGLE